MMEGEWCSGPGVKGERKVSAVPAGPPKISSLPAGPGNDRVRHERLCLRRRAESSFYLQLLLQFTVKPRQHRVCLLVSSYRRLDRLFVLSY